MPSTYTVNLGLEKPATGEQAGSWGNTVNASYDYLDTAIDGNLTIPLSDANYSLVTNQGADSQGRNKLVIWTGTLSAQRVITIQPPTAKKLYLMKNATAGGFPLLFQQSGGGGGGGVLLAAGKSAWIYCDGSGATTAAVQAAFDNPQFTTMALNNELDLVADPFWGSFSARLLRASGVNGMLSLEQHGTGALQLITDEAAPIQLTTTGVMKLKVDAANGVQVRSGTAGATFAEAGLAVTETNGNIAGDLTYSPRVGFSWAGVGAAQIGLDASGVIRTFDGPGTGYGAFTTGILTAGVSSASGTALDPSLAAFRHVMRVIGSSGLELAIGAGASASNMWLQAKDTANDGLAFPLLVNPLGGNVGVGKSNPGFALDVQGDVNVSGVFRVNGVPLALGGTQTPWTSNIDAANHILYNVANIGVGVPSPAPTVLPCPVTVDKATPGTIGPTGEGDCSLYLRTTNAFGPDIGAILGFGGPSGNAGNPTFPYAAITGRKDGSGQYQGYLAFTCANNLGAHFTVMKITFNGIIFPNMLPTGPGAHGTLWYDPSDGNRVKLAP